MKLLIFSDLHLHPFPFGAKINSEGFNTRLVEIVQALGYILNLAEKQNCDAILFTGDFFHTKRLEVETLELAYRALGQCSIPIYAISGNHDQTDDIGQVSAIHGIKTLLQGDTLQKISGVMVDGYSFRRKPMKPKFPKANIVMLHTGITGAAMGADFIEEDAPLSVIDLWNSGPRLIIAGHYHQPQLFTPSNVYLPQGNDGETYDLGDLPALLIPGAPVQHNFGDSGSVRGCWTYDERSLTFHPVPGPQFFDTDDMERDQRAIDDGPKDLSIYLRPKPKREEKAYENRIGVNPETAPEEVMKRYIEAMKADSGLLKIGKELYGI